MEKQNTNELNIDTNRGMIYKETKIKKIIIIILIIFITVSFISFITKRYLLKNVEYKEPMYFIEYKGIEYYNPNDELNITHLLFGEYLKSMKLKTISYQILPTHLKIIYFKRVFLAEEKNNPEVIYNKGDSYGIFFRNDIDVKTLECNVLYRNKFDLINYGPSIEYGTQFIFKCTLNDLIGDKYQFDKKILNTRISQLTLFNNDLKFAIYIDVLKDEDNYYLRLKDGQSNYDHISSKSFRPSNIYYASEILSNELKKL